MAKIYGEELRKAILAQRARLQEAVDRRAEHLANCDFDLDDCFVSEHVERDGIRECNMQLEILDTDGLMDYDAIIDENGNEVRVHWFTNKWGRATVVGNGVFASSISALLKKTGWTEKTIRVPVWTKFCAGGVRGIAGVMCGSAERVRWHTNMVTGEYVGYPD